MTLDDYLPEAKRRYEVLEAREKRDADLPGGIGAKNVHFMPFDKLPRTHQLRLAETIRDHEEGKTA